MRKKNLTQEELDAIEIISSLSWIQRGILESRYLSGLSLKDTAKLFRISDERVREIENIAIKNIQSYVKGRKKKILSGTSKKITDISSRKNTNKWKIRKYEQSCK